MLPSETLKNLHNNLRFYSLLLTFLVSVFAVCLLRIQVSSDQLFYMRIEQTFGFLAVIALYFSLIISPIKTIVGEPGWVKNLIQARRGIGVAAAYFAIIHVVTVVWGQFGGLNDLTLLPQEFILPFIFGAIALLIFIEMTISSFDKVIMLIGFPLWKRTHELVYLAGILIILHAWMIGTHLADTTVQIICFIALVVLFALESWRMARALAKHHAALASKTSLIALGFLVLWIGFLLAIPQFVQNFNQAARQSHGEGQMHE